jgi:hypothetical protein
LAVSVDENRVTAADIHSVYASDKSCCLSCLIADANRVGVREWKRLSQQRNLRFKSFDSTTAPGPLAIFSASRTCRETGFDCTHAVPREILFGDIPASVGYLRHYSLIYKSKS